ncbi:hypothetical protein EW145_g3980 [Phellinidium pouzarii]|uniref:Uncharacterized protein n=1 Tax=Phellinidium pouzarii TaxID=167371 RepID=A0A4S4L5E8_9AGAM|nr:hypothetical protein EW145_g3980 [Phellinidium pouzarii]
MSMFYDLEIDRMKSAREAFYKYYQFPFTASAIKTYSTDGDLRVFDLIYALIEGKLELASTGAEPLFQAAWYYNYSAIDKLNGKFNFPCLIIYLFGAHIGFAGAVWTDTPHVQVLCPVLPLFYHQTDTKMRERAARCFGAAKKAIIRKLKILYERLDFERDPPINFESSPSEGLEHLTLP